MRAHARVLSVVPESGASSSSLLAPLGAQIDRVYGRYVHVCTAAKRTNLPEAHNPPSGTSPLNLLYRNPKVGRVLAYLGYLGASATSDMSDGTRDDVDPRACAATLLEDGLSDLASQGSVIDVDISSSSI